MNLIQDCILCYNEFEEGSASCGDTQNLSEVCCKYLHPLITQKISSSHSSRDKLLLCPKCFETVVELKDLNQQLAFLQARISELVFIRSLEILHRRGKSNSIDDNRSNDDNLERQLLLIELDVSTLPNCDFTKVNSNVPKDIVTSKENYNVKNPVEDTCFEELPDPLLIPLSDINTVDVTFETIKVERDEVDLIDNSHGVNNITENVDADLCVEESKQISGISTVKTKTKGKNPILKRQKLNYWKKLISIKEKQDNFGAEDGQNMQIDETEKAPRGNLKIADASKISSDGCFNGSSQNCVSTMNLGSISEEKIAASATTSGTISSSTSELGNQNSHLIESVSKNVHCQVIDEVQQELQEVLPEIHAKKNDSKNDLSNESKNRCRRVLRSKIGHRDRGKINYKSAASGKGFDQQCDLKNYERVYSEKRSVHTSEKRFQRELTDASKISSDGCFNGSFQNCVSTKNLGSLSNQQISEEKNPASASTSGTICSSISELGNQNSHLIESVSKNVHCQVIDEEQQELQEVLPEIHAKKNDSKNDLSNESKNIYRRVLRSKIGHGKGVSQQCDLKKHERVHSEIRCYNSKVCGKGFIERGNLKAHKKMHTGGKPFQCEFCGKGFSKKCDWNVHVIRIHTKEKPYKCEFCAKEFVTKVELKIHVIRIHTKKEKPYKCKFCAKEFVTKVELKIHVIRIHTKEKPYKCDFCAKGFVTKTELKLHVTSIHTDTEERPYKCEVCDKGFKQQYHMTRHYRKVHTAVENRRHKCEFCQKSFAEQSAKERHARIHTGERQYNCEVCGKGYNEKYYLKVHKRIHTGEKPYKCEFCGKGFTQKCSLNDHVRTHSGEKCYKCGFCGESFLLKKGLIQHISTHTGEKPYKCKFCGKEFARQSYMAKHVKIHTGQTSSH